MVSTSLDLFTDNCKIQRVPSFDHTLLTERVVKNKGAEIYKIYYDSNKH